MTAASGAPGHLDPEALADLTEGLLEPADADAARRHLGTCSACADDYALISGEQSFSVAPEPIPAEVFARIEAALYREPPLTAAKPSAAGVPRSQAPLRQASAPWGRRFKLAFSSLAGATALIVVGYVGISALSSSSATKSSASTAAGARPYAAPANPGPEQFSANSDADVKQIAIKLLANLPKGALAEPNAASTGTTPNEPAVKQCWYNAKPGITPLTSAPTNYLGQTAEVVVYAVPGDSTKADVFVVTASCSPAAAPSNASEAHAPGVLTELQVPRP